MQRGELWWANLPTAVGSEPGFSRPVLIVQADSLNRSRINTAVVAAITSNLALAEAPGNIRLSRRVSGLPKTSVVNVSQLLTVDRSMLVQRMSSLNGEMMRRVDAGLRLVLGLG